MYYYCIKKKDAAATINCFYSSKLQFLYVLYVSSFFFGYLPLYPPISVSLSLTHTNNLSIYLFLYYIFKLSKSWLLRIIHIIAIINKLN